VFTLAWTTRLEWHWTSNVASYGRPIVAKPTISRVEQTGPSSIPLQRRGRPTETPTQNVEKTLLEKFDPATLAGAIILAIVAVASDPWWTLSAPNVFTILVSPFYVHVNAVGLSDVNAATGQLGTATRILALLTSLILALSSLRPQAWWRKPALWFSYTSIGEVFLSLFLMIHAVQTSFLATYGYSPPIIGDMTIPGRIIGLDLTSYQSPILQTGFAASFLIGLSSVLVVSIGEIYLFLHNQEPRKYTSDLTKGFKEVHLAPPYHHIWVSTSEKTINPLSEDPEKLSDTELGFSFRRLGETLAPGGLVSIVVPGWAAALSERLLKILPWTGLHLERSEVIYRTPGKPENELVFRKPMVKTDTLTLEVSAPIENVPSFVSDPASQETEEPPVEAAAEPAWTGPQMNRLQQAMVKSATTVIERHKEPVLYRELVNEVYMDLLDRKVQFESARQIENTLISRVDKELTIVEGFDETNGRLVRKWWLGEEGVPEERKAPFNIWKRLSKITSPTIPKFKQLLHKVPVHRTRSRYNKKKRREDED